MFKVAIMGCGPGGAYLYRLLSLKRPDIQVDVFDIQNHRTACRIKPCGWAVNYSPFAKLCRDVDIDPSQVIIGVYDSTLLNDKIKARADIAIINKPALLRRLMSGEPRTGGNLTTYDRIIDATGRREYLPSVDANRAVAYQVRCEVNGIHRPTAWMFRDSVAWAFPLRKGEAHIGAASIIAENAAKILSNIQTHLNIRRVICSCSGSLACSGPLKPFTSANVWGLGESIGLVDPFTGAGIIQAMDSARLIYEHWDDSEGYEQSILDKYGYMGKAADVVEKIRVGQNLNLRDMRIVVKCIMRQTGVKLTLWNQIKMYIIRKQEEYQGHYVGHEVKE